MATLWQQQVFALDARYNAHRASNHVNFRTLYIRRRSQLLREHSKEETTFTSKQYLKLRSSLLQQRYGVCYDQASLRSRSTSARSTSRLSECGASDGVVVPTDRAAASRAIVGGGSIADNYAFAGVHHIFDQHEAAVTTVRFANNDRARLCCASMDGTVSICDVGAEPPRVIAVLRGHTLAVTGCDWSASNDLVASCSLDGNVRLWDIPKQTCLRSVCDPTGAEMLSCLFVPANNNMVVAGNGQGVVRVLNVSTGIYPRGGSAKVGGRILALAADASGRLIWAGNDKGVIVSFLFDLGTGRLSKLRRSVVAADCAITSLSWRAWVSREARNPSLLVNIAANVVCLFSVKDKEGGLELKRKFAVKHKTCLVRSTFCPIMSFRQGACIVTGSEDSCVYFLDIERDGKASCVNKLQGHACPVLGVSFNYDESLLATSDQQGLVIVWKREQPNQ